MSDFISDYWHRIDLHSHSKGGITKDGKSDKTSYTHADYLNHLRKAGFKLKAVTNHNTLRIEDHVVFAILSRMAGASYIPGVELDLKLKNSAEGFQAVLLFDPARNIVPVATYINQCTESKRLSLTGKKGDCFYFDEKNLLEIIKDMSLILVVHAEKASGIAESQKTAQQQQGNLIWIYQEICRDHALPVLFENSRSGRAQVIINRMEAITSNPDASIDASRVVSTTDDHFRDSEEAMDKRLEEADYRINAEPSFRGLRLSIQMYKTRFKHSSKIIKPTQFIKSISFSAKDTAHFQNLHAIELSPYLNVIIGDSGSGKTLLLNSIYRAIKGEDLDIHLGNSSRSGKASLYSSLLPKTDNFINIEWSSPLGPGRVIELNKIYTSILHATDETEAAKKFGLSPMETAGPILSKYISKMHAYEDLSKSLARFREVGAENLEAIRNGTSFLLINEPLDSPYVLSPIAYDNTKILSLQTFVDELQRKINDFSSLLFLQDIQSLKRYVLEKDANLVDDLVEQYKKIVGSMNQNLILQKRQLRSLSISQRIHLIVNDSIHEQNQLFGDKVAAVSEAKKNISVNSLSLASEVANYLRARIQIEKIDLAFPQAEISKVVEEKEKNDYVRLRANYTDESLIFTGPDIRGSKIFEEFDKRASCKAVPTTNMEDSAQVKRLCDFFIKNGPKDLSTLISKEVPYSTDVRIENEWKNYAQINPGSLVKAYMDYFFNDVILKDSPNTIFIDQPENDVDKRFITETLCKFIIKRKHQTQFIITSHEPIIAVNSDANRIIEAKLVGNKQITYDDYSLEGYTQDSTVLGTDEVAAVLDGGKNNVFIRNEIYGGKEW